MLESSSSGQAAGLRKARPVVPPAERTAAHQARLAERRVRLTEQLAGIFEDKPAFVFEVGSGHGHFLTAYAKIHPERLCVGLDIASDRVERALRKRDRAKLGNLHFLQAEAGFFLEVLPAEIRLADVYVLFPDPWPKARHHKHRILQPRFLTQLAGRMGRGARLFFRTDFAPYFEDARRTVQSHPVWQLVPEAGAWPFECETVFQSRAPVYHSLIAELRPPA
jgi:tRNA (guanine-N7-)-methyltransferase